MYDPKVGQWLTEDPIGFRGGDSNLRRYVGNNPVTNVDPDGLRSISIYINPNNLPGNFNAGNVSLQLQKMFAAAGIMIPINVIVSPRKPDPSKESYYKGTEYTCNTGYWNSGWWNFHPGVALFNTLDYFLWEPLVPFSKSTEFYTHFVEFTTPSTAGYVAETVGNETIISVTGLNQQASAKGTVNWDVLYANILMHEVMYLGYLDYFDDPSAPPGALESNQASATMPITLPPWFKKKLDWYFAPPCK